MKRRTDKPAAILMSDAHLRETVPVCRVDDFWKTQWGKVVFIRKLQDQYQCPVLCGGDLFHHWKPSPYLLTTTIECIPNQFYTVYGQHDLPNHNLDLLHKSGIFTLFSAGALQVFGGTHFGQDVTGESLMIGSRKILVWHNLTWHKMPPWPDCPATPATRLLEAYPAYDLMLMGDNHVPFVVRSKTGNLLVNPGSLMRQTADQVNHTPRVYLWYASSNTVKPVFLPIQQGVISREHLDKQHERDERIEAFISRLNNDWKTSVSFSENLDRFAAENLVRKSVMDIIRKAIDE